VEWKHLLRARKEVGCYVSLGYVPLGSEMSSMLLVVAWKGTYISVDAWFVVAF